MITKDHIVDTHVADVQKEQYGMYWFQAKQVPLTKLFLSSMLLRLTYFGISAMRSKCLFAELIKNGMSPSFKKRSLLARLRPIQILLYLRTRYRYMKGVSSVSFGYLDTDTINKSWLKMYLRYRYRSKLGWIFWFGPIHVAIRRNLDFWYFAVSHLHIGFLVTKFKWFNWQVIH